MTFYKQSNISENLSFDSVNGSNSAPDVHCLCGLFLKPSLFSTAEDPAWSEWKVKDQSKSKGDKCFQRQSAFSMCPYNSTKEQTFSMRWHCTLEFGDGPVTGYHLLEGPIRSHHSICGWAAMLPLIPITTVSPSMPLGAVASVWPQCSVFSTCLWSLIFTLLQLSWSWMEQENLLGLCCRFPSTSLLRACDAPLEIFILFLFWIIKG